MDTNKQFVILIAGASGSGKSTFANEIYKSTPKNKKCVIICQDSYYHSNHNLTQQERRAINYDHPSSFEWDLMINQIEDLKNNNPIKVPIYDYKKEERISDFHLINEADIIILEGIYALYNEKLNALADLKVFIETPKDECLIRRLTRDIYERGRNFDSVVQQWRETVSPMYDQFIEPSKRNANVTIVWNKNNRVALNLVKTWLQQNK